MFRRSGALIAIIAVALVLIATVSVLAQTGSSPAPENTGDAVATVTQAPQSSVADATGADAGDAPDTTGVTPTAPPVQENSAPAAASTSESALSDVTEPFAPLTPYTPRLPEGTGDALPPVEAPLQLRIPSIGVDTAIEWVGVDEDGNMDVPSTYRTVAWYEHGPRPGMTGNAVVAGHLDSQTGPAVFYRLSELKAGDEIVVVAHDGQELRFLVDGMERFNSATAPMHDIFGPASGRHLNLITCEGTFDPGARQYDERLVIYSTLITG